MTNHSKVRAVINGLYITDSNGKHPQLFSKITISTETGTKTKDKVEHKQLAIKQDATYLIIYSDCLQ